MDARPSPQGIAAAFAFAAQSHGQVRDAFAKVVKAAQRLVEALSGLSAYQRAELDLQARRKAHGGNSEDAVLHPHRWLSAVCSGWLCETCPSEQWDLSCTCRCHRRRSAR